MTRPWLFAILAGGAVPFVACGGTSRSGFNDSTNGNSPNDPSLATGDGGALANGVGTNGGSDGCADETRQIYLVTEERDLVRFAPQTLTFTTVGKVACPSGGATPFSMAVDRSGTAWVEYDDGKLWKVDTKTAACSATSFKKGQQGFDNFGMAYATDAAGGTAETLFVANNDGTTLGKIDAASLVLSTVGTYDGFGGRAELTGNGNGELYGFFPPEADGPIKDPRVVRLDPKTGKIKDWKNVVGTDIDSTVAFACAFWGGDFYLFTGTGGESTVTKFTWGTGDSTTVKSHLPYLIVGAGVSTCAPVTNPK